MRGVADPACSDSQLASLQTVIHQLEGDVSRWTKSLKNPAVQANSPRHLHTANVRWHGASMLGLGVNVASVLARDNVPKANAEPGRANAR